MLEKIKQHPYIVGGVAILIIVWWLFSRNAGTTTASTDPNAADMQYSLQSQAMQLQANQAASHDAATLQALNLQYAGQYALAQLQAQTQGDANQLSANIALEQINAQAQTTALITTKQAEVQNNQINAATEQTAIVQNANTMNIKTMADALVAQTQAQADVAKAAISNQCHGFGCLF
jgi:hypothetical protein